MQQEVARVLQETSRSKRKDACRERIEAETKRRRSDRLLLLDLQELEIFPQVDSILLEQLNAYANKREEEEDGDNE